MPGQPGSMRIGFVIQGYRRNLFARKVIYIVGFFRCHPLHRIEATFLRGLLDSNAIIQINGSDCFAKVPAGANADGVGVGEVVPEGAKFSTIVPACLAAN